MKVLFAIGSDKTSKLVVDKYYEKYGETLEYKNVFYFKAILKAIKEDKTYDRIVISEELEQFSSNNIEAIDKFLFGKIDELTDEIQDTDIILICSDRRQRGDPFLERLFSIGIYNVLLNDDRNFDPLCESIRRPKNKREAKEYLNINSITSSMGGMVADDEVEEAQIINIIKHYEKLGDNTSSYVQSFDRIAEQYSRGQLKIIVKFLPPKVQNVLQNEEKYRYLFGDFAAQSQITSNQQSKPQTVYKPEKKGLFSIIRQNKNKEQENREYEDKKRLEEEKKRAEAEKAEQDKIQKEQEKLRQQEEKLRQEQEKLRIQNEKRKKEIEEERKQETLRRQEEDKKNKEQEAERKRLAEERLKYENVDSNVIIENKVEKTKASSSNIVDSPIIDVTISKEQMVTKEKPIRIIDEDLDNKIEVQSPKAVQADNSSSDENIRIQKLEEERKILEEKRQSELAEIAKKEEELKRQQEELKRAQERQQEEMRIAQERQQEELRSRQEEFDAQRQKNIASRQVIDTNLPSDYRKVVLFVGANKSGTTFMVNAVSHSISEKGVSTALLDMTKDRSLYYIYNQDDYKLRQIASECMQNLIEGRDTPIPVTRRLNVYTALPGSSGENRKGYRHKAIIDTLKLKNSLIVIDADFTTPADYFEQASEIYVVQDLDILKLQETTLFLRELKNRKIDMSKIRIIVNKYVKTALTPKKIVEGLSYYNDPSMSFIDELLTSKVPYSVIPYDLNNYAQYVEGLYKNEINYRRYTADFINAIEALSAEVYPQNGIQKKNKRGIFG